VVFDLVLFGFEPLEDLDFVLFGLEPLAALFGFAVSPFEPLERVLAVDFFAWDLLAPVFFVAWAIPALPSLACVLRLPWSIRG
jgi:hypothetical protein